MSWLSRILLGLALVAVGYAFVRYAHWLVMNIGSIPWANKYLGSTHRLYRIFGIIIIILGFLVMTNLLNSFLEHTIGALFNFS